MTPTEKGRYLVLDLLRGVAAVAVLLYHIGYMFGDYSLHLGKGYLAVDFFFVLSGFVIAANYHAVVRPGLSFSEFCVARISRLWPLFFLTTVIGFFVVVAKLSRDFGYFAWGSILSAFGLNLFMIPAFLAPYGIDRIFIFNGASWSVFFELIINLLFVLFLRNRSARQIFILCCASATLLALTSFASSGLDGGWSSQNFHVGLIRVMYGFSAGILMFLWGRRLDLRIHSVLSVAFVAALWGLLSFDGLWWVDVLVVVFIFPLLVLIASRCELFAGYGRIASWLGDVSYSVYLWQTPLMLLSAGLVQKLLNQKIASFAPVAGLIFLFAMMLFSYLSWRFFELPAKVFVRSWLMRFIRGRVILRGISDES